MLDVQAFKYNERLAWDLCAENYDRCLAEIFRPFSQKLLSLADLHRGQTVLDVATGSGLAGLSAARAVGPDGKAIGIDLSLQMLEVASKRIAEAQGENARFIQMDAEDLGFIDQSFDAVLCALGLMLFPQPDRALSEMYRVLRPGGRVALSVFGRGSMVALRALMDPFLAHMPPAQEGAPSTFGFGRGDRFQRALREAGFSHSEIQDEDHVLTLQSPERAWEMVVSLGRLGQAEARLGEDERALLRQDVLRIAREKYENSPGVLELPFQITYAVAVR
jgi:ubiquinone/menaquinone biosynthesis C-methylase UbiE